VLGDVRGTTLAERCCAFDEKFIDKGSRVKKDDVEGPKLEAGDRTIFLSPVGDDGMGTQFGDLVDVADDGEGQRARRVVPWAARRGHETGCSV
jgi:hypothetical protein